LTIRGDEMDIVIVKNKRAFIYRWVTGLATVVDGLITLFTFGCVHTSIAFKMVCKDAKYRCRNKIEMKVITIGSRK